MAKTIALSDDVYEILIKLKRKDESFSDVIRRLLPPRTMLQDIAGKGTFSLEEWEEVSIMLKKQSSLSYTKQQKHLEEMQNNSKREQCED